MANPIGLAVFQLCPANCKLNNSGDPSGKKTVGPDCFHGGGERFEGRLQKVIALKADAPSRWDSK